LTRDPVEYGVGKRYNQKALFIEELPIEFDPTLRGQVSSLNRAANGACLKLRTHAEE
jgi:hypothetical protein